MNLKLACVVLLFVVVGVASASQDSNKKTQKVVCYLGTWANYRHGEGKFLIENIDPFLCTHIVYGFAKLSENKIAAYDSYLDLKKNWGLGAYQRFNKLKEINPKLTTIIAIGGWNEGSTKYSQMASNAATRAIFVNSVVDFCLEHGFDGLDMDWEYPANRGGVPEDKANFVLLLKDLKEAFKPHGLILTAAVSAGKATMDTAYDIPNVAKYLDIINVMAYDLHGAWEDTTGHNAPLYARDEETEHEKTLTVDYAIRYWIKQGAPKEKIVLGMPLYGRSFQLKKPADNGIGAPVRGKGRRGPITKEEGMLGYNEICKFVLHQGWTSVWVDKIDAPYAYKGDQWVGYDDRESIKKKVAYLKDMQLGGGMVWSLETDDFRGLCFGEKYPLLSIIAEELIGPITRVTVDPSTLTTRPTLPPPVRPTSKPYDFKCTTTGYFRHPTDCSKFFHCVMLGEGNFIVHEFSCGDGMAFDESTKVCNHREAIPGC